MPAKFTSYNTGKPLKEFPVKGSPASKIKEKVIGATSDLLSYPARRKAQKAMIKSDQIAKDVKTLQDYKGYDTSDKDYRDPVFRAKANISNFKTEQMQALRSKK